MYKAATLHVSVGQEVLAQELYSSKSFGGTKNAPAVKVTDEIKSDRKMKFAIEVAKYVDGLPKELKSGFPKGYQLMRVEELREALQEITKQDKKTAKADKKAAESVKNADIIKEAFEALKENESMPDSGSESESESGECSE